MLAFPCNQFGAQEPGTNDEILAFARSRYDAHFPMFAKTLVNGPQACDLYRFLKAARPEPDGSEDIPWNFTKFLVDGSGRVLTRHGPATTPEQIESEIDARL